jgi:amidase
MCRSVADAALLLSAITGTDPSDAASKAGAGKGKTDYAKFLDPKGLEGARIGVPRKGLYGQSAPADRLVEAAIADMKRLGAVIVDPADIETTSAFEKTELEVLLYEFKTDLNLYLAPLPNAHVRTLKDLIAFNEKNRDAEMPFFGQEIFEMAERRAVDREGVPRRPRP